MLAWVNTLGSLFWLPIPLAVAHWFWCRLVAYPLFLEARIREGKSWIYLPIWWNPRKRRLFYFVTLLLLALPAITAACTLHFLLSWGWIALGFYLALFVLLLLFSQQQAIRKNYLLQRDCYFLDYHRLAHQMHLEGKPLNDADLRNRCMWEHQSNLRQADRKKRLGKYLKAKAASKKKPESFDDEI
jgi:hypothetical protein